MNKFAVSVDLPQGNLGSRSILLASNIEKFKQRRKLVFHECYSLSLKTDKETTERKNKLFRQYCSVFSESLLGLSGGHRQGKMSHPLSVTATYQYVALRLLHIIAPYSSPPLFAIRLLSVCHYMRHQEKRESLQNSRAH